MHIYIASSFKNLAKVHALRDELQSMGHTVLDWSELAPPIPAHASIEERKRLLDSDERGNIFTFCSEACASVDLIIYLGSSGQDAGVEIGMAYASGTPILGLAGEDEKAGLMLNGCVAWVKDEVELLDKIQATSKAGVYYKASNGAVNNLGLED